MRDARLASAFSCASAISILNDAQIGADGVLPIVELADPAIAPAVQVVVTTSDASVSAIDRSHQAYEAAVKANSPARAPYKEYQELLAALAALKATAAQLLAAAHVSNPTELSLIQDIMGAVISEIVNVINLINPTAAVNGHLSVTTMPTNTEWRAEHAAFKNRMKAIYSRTTGNAQLDAQIHQTAKKF